MKVHPVIIIGAGPAGLAAAMQLERQGVSALVFERSQVGGLLWNANLVENYPGFVDGITGPDLVDLFQKQATRLGVKVIHEDVVEAKYREDLFRIVTNKGEYHSSLLVIASGTLPNQHTFGKLPEAVNEKIFSEISPIVDVKDKDIVIIGAGDAALDYSLNLARHNQVMILNRGDQIKGLGLLWDRVQDQSAIKYIPDTEVIGVDLDQDGRLKLDTHQGNSEVGYHCDYLITAIGRKPNISFADKSIIENEESLLGESKLFLIGDLVNGMFRQTTIAVADGIRAAMIIGDLLEKG